MNETVKVTVDAGKWCGKLAHTWNYIGYDECNYTHSPGGMELIGKFGKLERPYYVRTHHMFCTGNMHGFYKWGSTNVYTEDENGDPVYYYDLIDEMFDILLRNNCKPYFELGFMPQDLADPRRAADGVSYTSNEYRQFAWSMPPKSYEKWYDLIFHLILHLKERFGEEELKQWYFELWNEPDYPYYWNGTKDEYCKMFDYTEAAVHAAMPEARFGGPSTCGARTEDAPATVFLRYVLNHIRNEKNYYSGETGTRIDFVSFHTKGGGFPADLKAKKQFPSVQEFLANIKMQTSVIKAFGYDKLECVLSEADPDGWAAGGRFDNKNLNFRNTEYYASYVISAYKNAYDLAEKLGMDIRPLAWAFMFEGERCFEGTRSFSTQGIDKAVFNLFKFLSRMGTQKIGFETGRDLDPLEFKDKNGLSEGPEIDGFATMDGEDRVQILLYCHHDDVDCRDVFDIDLELKHLPMDGEATLTHLRIDSDHSNAYAEWVRQGMPNYPDNGQREAIVRRSGLEYAEAPKTVRVENGSLKHTFTLPVHGISLLEIRTH